MNLKMNLKEEEKKGSETIKSTGNESGRGESKSEQEAAAARQKSH